MTERLDLLREMGWAPGNYSINCCVCGYRDLGDKRSIRCEECAQSLVNRAAIARQTRVSSEEPMKTIATPNLDRLRTLFHKTRMTVNFSVDPELMARAFQEVDVLKGLDVKVPITHRDLADANKKCAKLILERVSLGFSEPTEEEGAALSELKGLAIRYAEQESWKGEGCA